MPSHWNGCSTRSSAPERFVERRAPRFCRDDPRRKARRAVRRAAPDDDCATSRRPIPARWQSAREVDGRQLGVEPEARLAQRQRRREADDVAAVARRRTRRRAVRRGAEDALPERRAVVDASSRRGRRRGSCRGRSCASASTRTRAMPAASAADWRSHADAALHRDRQPATRRTRGGDAVDGDAEVLEQHARRAPTRRSGRCRRRRARGSSAAPTYLRQPSVTPASTATRGTPGGQHRRPPGGVLTVERRWCRASTRRARRCPRRRRRSRAAIASATSEPVAMTTARGPAAAAGQSART